MPAPMFHAPLPAFRCAHAGSAHRAPNMAPAAFRTGRCRSPRQPRASSAAAARVHRDEARSLRSRSAAPAARRSDWSRDSARATGVISRLPGLRLCKFDPMTHVGAGHIERSGAKLQHARRAAARKAYPPRLHVDDAVDDHALDRRARSRQSKTASSTCEPLGSGRSTALHPARARRVTAVPPRASRVCQQRRSDWRRLRRYQRSEQPTPSVHPSTRVLGSARSGQALRHPWHPCYFFMLSIIGNSTVMNLMAAGPMVTIHTAGKMQKTSGNTIFTPVFAAASSAR